MLNGIPQYSIVNQLAVTNAILVQQICKIRPSHVKCSQKQLGLDSGDLRNKYKKEHLHDLHIDQVVIYQDSTSKQWYPATITRLCKKPRSYIITTKEGVQYR